MTYVSSQVPEAVEAGSGRIVRFTLAVLTSFRALPRLSRQWRQHVSERRHLLELDDHVLADFGLTRQAAVEEAAKPFWRSLDPGSGR